MITPENVKQFNRLLVEFYETPNLLLFLSDDIEESKEFEQTVSQMTNEVEQMEISVYIIKDTSSEFKELFEQYNV